MNIINGDCLKEMKNIPDKSVDLVFCDLPYQQTACSWDKAIDLKAFWKEIMRVKKLNTPLFFTTTTKYGVELINSAPKKCPFRYDLVWVKSSPVGFLNARRLPMRKHEMVYVFYEKLPLYDLSSHKHKFIKTTNKDRTGKCYAGHGDKTSDITKYDPPLPTSIVKEDKADLYNKERISYCDENGNKIKNQSGQKYDPPLPTSIIDGDTYNTKDRKKPITREPPNKYDPPLPTSVVKEDYEAPTTYGKNSNKKYNKDFAEKNGYNKNQVLYEPPLPTSVIKDGQIYNGGKGMKVLSDGKGNQYDPPLPTSIVAEPEPEPEPENVYGFDPENMIDERPSNNRDSVYDPPLPTTMLEIKSTKKGNHSTEKPVALMEWVLKYFSKEGDIVLDPTMGSGSTGVACKNMNRDFIGIEMDKEIFEVAKKRLN